MDQQKQSQTFNEFISTQLNPAQQKAVLQKNGGVLVIAGAGSGKTRIITSRIAQLILQENVAPRSIVALTFTNKAAGEMKERLNQFFEGNYALPFVGTFHSYCLLLLRTNPGLLPFEQFTIMDADDQLALINKIVKQHNLGKYTTASQLLSQISSLKNKTFMGLEIQELTTPLVRDVYAAYEEEKAQSHCFDFDDLILQVLTLFKKNANFRKKFQERVRHVLVDEYQDTSHVQHQLLKFMGLDEQNKFALDSLCAVGDEDQSIYSWRGATVTNMLKFETDFAPVNVVKVEQNYRSVEPILQVANSVIANNRLRNPKNLWSEKQAKNRVLTLQCRSSDQEAEAIAVLLQTLPDSIKRHEVAILYRTHFQSRHIEEALIRHSIPYKIVGGIRFYERKEIKDLLAYLRLIVNPYDKISLLRVINCPHRGLGKKFEEGLMESWQHNRLLDFKQLLPLLIDEETTLKQSSLKEFLAIFDGMDKDSKPLEALQRIVEATEYFNYLRASFEAREAETKIENVRELLQSVIVYEENRKESGDASLENFLHEVSLLQEQIQDQDSSDQVQMMTLHAAKGLEFKIVLLSGMEEGLLPSSKSLNSSEALEEERRLFYVGITRAKEYLILFCANFRHTFGQIVDQVASRFITEMPENLVQHVDIEKMHPSQISYFFAKLLGGKQTTSSVVTFGRSFDSGPTPPPGNRFASAKKTSSFSAPVTKKKSFTPIAYPYTNKPQTNRLAEVPVTTQSESTQSMGGWTKNQTVHHDKFGTGIVTSVEKAEGDDFYITALFRIGKKKILSSFLSKI